MVIFEIIFLIGIAIVVLWAVRQFINGMRAGFSAKNSPLSNNIDDVRHDSKQEDTSRVASHNVQRASSHQSRGVTDSQEINDKEPSKFQIAGIFLFLAVGLFIMSVFNASDAQEIMEENDFRAASERVEERTREAAAYGFSYSEGAVEEMEDAGRAYEGAANRRKRFQVITFLSFVASAVALVVMIKNRPNKDASGSDGESVRDT